MGESDIGKEFHWMVAIDGTGGELRSRRVENSETDLLSLIAELEALCRDTLWAVATSMTRNVRRASATTRPFSLWPEGE